MCMNTRFSIKPRDIYPNYEERLELVKARVRLDDWLERELKEYNRDPKIEKQMIRRRNKLPLNM